MGADIHLLVEKLNGEKWEEVEPPYSASYGIKSWSPYYENRNFDHGKPDPLTRDYNLFAFLADVRNGRGFAGVFTHERITPCFSGRGIPDDCSYVEPINDEDENRIGGSYSWLGEHSFTWATLTELLNAPWGVRFNTGYDTWTIENCEFRRWCDEVLVPLSDGDTDNIRVVMGFDS